MQIFTGRSYVNHAIDSFRFSFTILSVERGAWSLSWIFISSFGLINISLALSLQEQYTFWLFCFASLTKQLKRSCGAPSIRTSPSSHRRASSLQKLHVFAFSPASLLLVTTRKMFRLSSPHARRVVDVLPAHRH